MLTRIRNRPASDLWGYLLFSHAWTRAWWSINVFGGYSAFGPGLPFTIICGAGPFLGGVIMSYVTYGRAGLRDLWERLFDLRRIRLQWALVTVAFFPAVALLTPVVTRLVTGTAVSVDAGELATVVTDPLTLVMTVLVILVVGPLPEEIGWRGYFLDRVQRRWSALVSGLTVGVIWASWHAPLFVMPGYYSTFDFAPQPALFATSVILVSVVYTWLYDNTGRSVAALIAFHFLENSVGQVTSVPQVADRVRVVLLAAVVMTIVPLYGPRPLRRAESVPSPPDRLRS